MLPFWHFQSKITVNIWWSLCPSYWNIGAERQTTKMKNKKQKLDSGYLYKALLDSTFTMPKSTLETSRAQTENVSASESLLCN